jgi:hypothetical protein
VGAPVLAVKPVISAILTWHGTGGAGSLTSAGLPIRLRLTRTSAKLTKGMRIFRRRLRVLATVWLVVQAGWVAALVPRDCCAAHRPTTVKTRGNCHESAAATHHCPMPAADGAPCPMHRGQSGPSQQHQSSTNDCTLRGTCDGPMAALFALLSAHGVLAESASAIPNIGVASVSTPAREDIISRLESPDPPPPRA